MKIRIISGIILGIIIIAEICLGGPILKYSLLGISLIGLFEFYRALNGKQMILEYMGYVASILYYLLLNKDIPNFLLIYTIVVIICFSIIMVLKYPNFHIHNITNAVFGIFYIPVLFSSIYLLYEKENGIFYVVLIFITAFATDTFAYFSGVLWGKRKLAPILSPNKTIEGSIGGIVGTFALCLIFGIIANQFIVTKGNLIFECLLIGLFGSIIAQFGDLTASAIKRFVDIKDYGNLIPGHGGILDRFDSILFTSGAIYIINLIING